MQRMMILGILVAGLALFAAPDSAQARRFCGYRSSCYSACYTPYSCGYSYSACYTPACYTPTCYTPTCYTSYYPSYSCGYSSYPVYVGYRGYYGY
ncbi:MAG: hypothetical protein KDA78_20485 [Planctomycetaceae bacterium]|nr:hypothetical protein [Planctomycetaceae bacterium]